MNATDILIYTPNESTRLHYILRWIFVEQWQQSYSLTQDIEVFKAFTGVKINYSKEYISEAITICPHSLLFEQHIQKQSLSIQRWKKTTVLFYNQPKAKVPFDIFAASFFLLSRYEEYLPHQSDRYGRFKASNSVAYQYHFLETPIVDVWIQYFAAVINSFFNTTISIHNKFMYLPTYDIDIAWAYRYRSKMNFILGGLKEILTLKWKPLKQRISYLKHPTVDPYDSFQELENLHKAFQIDSKFFWLVGLQKSTYDRNADPQSKEMQHLIKSISTHNAIGLHPSYLSNNSQEILKAEKKVLENIVNSPIRASRQHFIKLHLPTTYQRCIDAGILEDYSMGYPDAQGFRAGTCQTFLWFDLNENLTTSLRVFPFVFMDATAIFYKKQTPKEAYKEFERLLIQVKQVNGTFISIMHNYTLGTAIYHRGWMSWYKKMLALVYNIEG